MELMGADMSGSIRNWGGAQRRVGSLLAITAAIVLLLAGVVSYVVVGDVPWLFWTLAGLLALVLAFVIVLLVLHDEGETDTDEDQETAGHAHLGPAAPAGEYPEEAPELDAGPGPRETKLTLRCGDCGTVFDIPDNGKRPLYHSCPGCGAEGVLREPTPVVQPPPAPVPAPEPADATSLPAAPAAAPSPLSAPRRLKLRCGGCKEVFVIEDTGERPLRRPCPHCSRMGEIR